MAFATAVFAAGEFQFVAEDPEQQAVGVELESVMRLIDDEFHVLILRPAQIPARGIRGSGIGGRERKWCPAGTMKQ